MIYFTVTITEFLCLVHFLGYQKNTKIQKLDLLPSSGENIGSTQSAGFVRLTEQLLSLPLYLTNGTNRVGTAEFFISGCKHLQFPKLRFLFGILKKWKCTEIRKE